MGFFSVTPSNIRNLVDSKIDVNANEVFLVGENGQGKTNLLETIYFLCYGSSFRTKRDEVIKKNGTEHFWVRGEYVSLQGDWNTIFISFDTGKKDIYVNKKRIIDRKDLIENIPCIVFSHDDIRFIKGSPDKQRWFFNQTLSLFDPYFIDLLRKYHKIVKMRNMEIKKGDIGVLDIFDQQLIQSGMEIQQKRMQTILDFNKTFSSLFKKISNADRDIYIRYIPSWGDVQRIEDVEEKVKQTRKRDIYFGTTTTGPHRDRIQFYSDNADFIKIASTGQIRLMSLSLRVAQALFFSKKTKRKPILLIDDVLLELDHKKRKKFIEQLPDYDQAFFTFLPDEPFLSYMKKDTLVYYVRNGSLQKG